MAPSISRLLVLNAGSSSLKFKLFDQLEGALVAGASGVVERIGDVTNSALLSKVPTADGRAQKSEAKVPAANHVNAMSHVLDFLSDNISKHVKQEVTAVGHRIVHGLDISQPALLTDTVIDTIKRAAVLAPLHNPPGLQGISAAISVFGKLTPQVAVFDTAYHQTMPPKAYMYGLPYDLYDKHAIRRYGFHGTSHQFLAQQATGMLGIPMEKLNAISCHLGAGSSIAAIKGGKSIDTTMGMTPLEGLLMASRCGDLDPAVVLHLQNTLGMTTQQVDTLMNRKSGLLGLCGASDVRAVLQKKSEGDFKAGLALDMLVYRVRKYIGAYAAALDGDVHAIMFSAGIGENSAVVRELICQGLQNLGIELSPSVNAKTIGTQADISAPGSKVRVLVVPTDEELAVAQQAAHLIASAK